MVLVRVYQIIELLWSFGFQIPGIAGNPNVAFAPSPGVIEHNTSNEVPSEYLINQGLSYPPANNYGYYYTGIRFKLSLVCLFWLNFIGFSQVPYCFSISNRI